MIGGAALGVFLPALAVYLLLTRWRALEAAGWGRGLAAASAPGLGFGLATCLYLLLVHVTPNQRTVALLDAGIWLTADAVLLISLLRRRTHGGRAKPALPALSAPPGLPGLPALPALAVGFVALCAIVLYAFFLRYAIRPEGEWDAFAIWNLRARAIARAAPDWSAILSPSIEWSSPHYPLLVPSGVARLWAYTGNESTAVPSAVGLLFFLSSVAFVMAGVGRLRGWPAALLAGLAVLIPRTYVYQGACQCADVPLGFFLLVATACVSMAVSLRDDGPMFAVAGMAAGLAAWTKNEGLVLLLLIALAAVLTGPRLRRALFMSAGAAIPLMVLALFKLSAESSNYLVSGQGPGEIAAKLADPSRWALVSRLMLSRLAMWGEVPLGALTWTALAAAIAARPDPHSVIRASTGLFLVLAMLAGYGLVYVVTPLALEWQVAVSADRLFVHLWPAFVWSLFQLTGEEHTRT